MGLHYRTPNAAPLIVVPVNNATPKQMSVTPLPCTQALITGFSAVRTPNATDAWIGPIATDGQQAIQISPGGLFVLNGVDLSEWYVDSTTVGDGVVIHYW